MSTQPLLNPGRSRRTGRNTSTDRDTDCSLDTPFQALWNFQQGGVQPLNNRAVIRLALGWAFARGKAEKGWGEVKPVLL